MSRLITNAASSSETRIRGRRCTVPAISSGRRGRYEYQRRKRGLALNIALTALRQGGDDYLSEKPPRLQLRKVDKKPVAAAIAPKGTKSPRTDEIETRPGPGATASRA